MTPMLIFCAVASILTMFVAGTIALYGAVEGIFIGRVATGCCLLIVSGLCFTLCYHTIREINR